MSKTITVAQLNKYVAALLDRDENLKNVQVSGELSGFKTYASGHMYFTLKDESASVSCVMFKGQAMKLKFKPENGMKVIITAKASLYDRDGRFQLYAQSMQPDGIGDLFMAFEQMKKKLEAEGLFAQEHKKSIPLLPDCIGVVTSASGAVIRDIINVLRRRFPGFKLQLIPVAVQGDQAAAQIAQAIKVFNLLGRADVLIVGRGGGSMEDLWAFNEEIVARAVYESKIPVISAVGHETDYTICDFAADMRAPTPSAAAELAIPVKNEMLMSISAFQERMKKSLLRRLEYQKIRLTGLTERPVIKNPVENINRRRQNLDWLQERLNNAQSSYLKQAAGELGILMTKLDALSPLKVMTRGYAVVTDSSNKTIQSTAFIHVNDEIDVALQDGTLNCRVINVKDRRM